MVDGNYILEAGIPKGPHVGRVLRRLKEDNPEDVDAFIANYLYEEIVKPEQLRLANQIQLDDGGAKPLDVNLEWDGYEENYDQVVATMRSALATPFTRSGMVLPDACPAGVLPVGGVVASHRLHPGFHSADVCCSMYLSASGARAPVVWDYYRKMTHFGPGGRRKPQPMPKHLHKAILNNEFTKSFLDYAVSDFATQGDGNHFGFVGHDENLGHTHLVTHHGSRRFGAKVYKKALGIAQDYCRDKSPDTPKEAAWIPDELTEEYWQALQIVKMWTLASHHRIHDMSWAGQGRKHFTPHNFVFQREGLYWHAKGATPLWEGTASVIPLNSSQPVLIVKATKNSFAPHGAGRIQSRNEFLRSGKEVTDNPHLEFYTGVPDLTEYPEAYKPVHLVLDRLRDCTIENRIMPFKSMMAGRIEYSRKKG